MSSLKIRLFGKFSLLHNDRELECLRSAKAKELFCYLLLHRDRPHPREILASVLWGDCTTSQSMKYLRQTLWQLQQGFHSLSPAGHVCPVHVDGEYLRLDSHSELWLDAAVFEEAFAPVRGTAGEEMEAQQAENLRNAVSLYRGDLVEGWFQDWCLYHRERLQNIYLAMLERLMEYCEFHGEYENGLSFGELLLHQDSARERTHFKLMRLRYLAGDRSGALRQFHRCATALEKELGVKPAKRTLELYEQILADQFATSPPAQAETDQQFSAKAALPSFFPRLERLRLLLLNLQRRVQRDIQEVDRVLAGHANRPPSGRD